MTPPGVISLAHGVGQVYESPIPLWLYLLGAAATVLASFAVRALVSEAPIHAEPRPVGGIRVARALTIALRVAGIVGLVAVVASGAVVGSEGFTLATLGFWVGLVVGMTTLSALIAGAWEAADPWAWLESIYRLEDSDRRERLPPWWIGPAALYLLFWFELVSGRGFEDWGVLSAVLLYTLFVFGFRFSFGSHWTSADPLSILFGFAARTAPFRLESNRLWRKHSLDELDRPGPMPKALFASVFVLLGSTTFDNVRETVGWGSFLESTNLDALPTIVADSIMLLAFGGLFLLPFLGAVYIARAWIRSDRSVGDLARLFGWGLIPIGVAYLLAHNAPLLISGAPLLLRRLSDPFDLGWNLFGTAQLFEGFLTSPRFVWFVEIVLIVGGHILGVLAAHRTGYRLAGTHRLAVRSQYPLTALMAVYTISTLWLLAQPLVA
jgi:hypothetical protein